MGTIGIDQSRFRGIYGINHQLQVRLFFGVELFLKIVLHMENYIHMVACQFIFSLLVRAGGQVDFKEGGCFEAGYQKAGCLGIILVHYRHVDPFHLQAGCIGEQNHLHHGYHEDNGKHQPVTEDLFKLFYQ